MTVPVIHTASIALGSNLGDRFANIERALRWLEFPPLCETTGDEVAYVSVVDTSFMYETAPMYVTDQPLFINCACLIETNVPPRRMLGHLKDVETKVGRVPSAPNGPRAIDLDVLTYDSDVIDTRDHENRKDLENLAGELVVPHPRMGEREFVLRPLNDMIPEFIHPVLKKPIQVLLHEIMSLRSAGTPPMNKVIPFPRYPLSESDPDSHLISCTPPTSTYWTFPPPTSQHAQNTSSQHKTYIMATLNTTPDSFSDGSMYSSLPTAVSRAFTSVAEGADIIDIGGYSTRPRAAYVSPEEEISRVVPVIQALRQAQGPPSKARDVLISVDTFRPEVANAAVLAGANCINDVYAFHGPEYPPTASSKDNLLVMRRIARDMAVPVVLMHSRGDAGSNKDYGPHAFGHDPPVLQAIRSELGARVNNIVKGRGGVRRWLAIVDPGIGFSKTPEDNLTVLRSASSITAKASLSVSSGRNPLEGFPQLIGASRKSFLGYILGQPDSQGTYEGRTTEPRERGWATAAAVACAVQQGAAIVRVHDISEMGDVVRVASALWGTR